MAPEQMKARIKLKGTKLVFLTITTVISSCASPDDIPSATRKAVECMISVIRDLPSTEQVTSMVAIERESGSYLVVEYSYREVTKRLQRERLPVSRNPVDGFYRVSDSRMALYDIGHVLAERCRVRPYVLVR
jgi:hypothetical protein